MKFTGLTIHNFLAITDADIRLDDRGLTLIQGINSIDTSANSNGAGKSSIADALCWCWFGTTARGVTGDDVINTGVGKDTFVTSSLIDDGLTYTATRHRKHKKGKNSLTLTMSNGLTETDLTKGTDKLTQEVANKIIGASLEVFTGAIYAGQEQMPDLPSLTDKMLKVLIEEAAGVTVLEEAYKKARESLSAVMARDEEIQRGHAKIAGEIAWLNRDIADLQASSQTWLLQNHQDKQDVLKDIKGRLMPELVDLNNKIALVDEGKLLADIADCDTKIGAVKGEQIKLRQMDAEASAADRDLKVLNRDLAAQVAKAQAMLAEVQNAKHKIGCPCDECGRPLTQQEMATIIGAAEARAEQEDLKLKKLRNDQILAVQVNERAAETLSTFEQSMTDLTHTVAQRAALMAERGQYDTLVSKRVQIVKEVELVKKKYADLSAAVDPYLSQVEAKETQRDKAGKDLDRIEISLVALEEELQVEREVVKVYSPSGVRARILDEVTPFLNVQTERYLQVLSDGNMESVWSTLTLDSKGNQREKFAIDVTNSTGASIFKGLSGGEKRKVRIATALALQDLVATRATKPIDLFIGDEIDDALDPAGLERLMMVLEDKARERGSVLIISHHEIQDMVRNVLTIEKTASGTVITETRN